jgi:hypothetical protein
MNQPVIWMTAPILSRGNEVWFSAYGFAWGYRAFAISCDAVRESPGAADLTQERIRVAFQSEKPALLRAIRLSDLSSYEGQRIRLALTEPGHPPVAGPVQTPVEPVPETPETTSCPN